MSPRTSLMGISVVMAMVLLGGVECGIYKMMAEAMMGHMMDGWGDSKGVTFGLKSKGMTAIIPIPMPLPIFTKDKGGGGKGGGQKVKYIPVPVPSGGGKEDWW